MSSPSHISAPDSLNAQLDDELRALETAGIKRTLHLVQQRHAGTVLVDGERLADFTSNDYLGLACDPRVARAASAVLQAEGTGAVATRASSGNHPVHEALEHALARALGVDFTLLFPSGYQANLGTMSSLVGPGDVVFLDELDHASIVDGARLSGAEIRTFPHLDVAALDAMLASERNRYRRAIVAVEGVFAWDADLFPLADLVEITRRHNAWSYVNDSHGVGVLGAHGTGTPEHFGVRGEIDIVVASVSKAYGTIGGCAGGSQELVELLVNRARSFMHSTATPPAMAAAALEAIRIADIESWRREAINERSERLRKQLSEAGLELRGNPASPVVPVMIGDAASTTSVVLGLRQRGFLVGGLKPPTVPSGTCRLRISLSAIHPLELVDALSASVIDAARESASTKTASG